MAQTRVPEGKSGDSRGGGERGRYKYLRGGLLFCPVMSAGSNFPIHYSSPSASSMGGASVQPLVCCYAGALWHLPFSAETEPSGVADLWYFDLASCDQVTTVLTPLD